MFPVVHPVIMNVMILKILDLAMLLFEAEAKVGIRYLNRREHSTKEGKSSLTCPQVSF